MANASIRLTDHRLVGRDEEMRLLVHALDRGVDRKPATVFISGDAGIGKTRLVTELAAVARDRGARLAHGDCIELGSDGLPYAPFVAIVRSLVSDLGVAEVLELAGPDAGELARLAPALDPSSEGTAEATSWGQARLSLAVVSLLEGLARRIPLVVILEDLHWADDSTRGLLPLVVRALLPARAVVVLTYRSEDLAAGHPTRRLLAELARRPGSVRMELGPLSRAEQALQLSHLHGVPPTPELLDAIYARAEGNPFFAEELVRSQASGASMPSDLRDLLLSRVLALPRATRDALRVAAAGGRAVPHTVLAGALGVDVTELEETLRPAFDHNVLRPDPDGRTYLFRHALLAEATASTLLPGEAQQVHTRLATTYESEHAATVSAPDRAAARARHWQAAGHRPRSLAASVAAARALARMLAFPEALRHYEAALALWDEVDDASSVAGESRATLQREAAEIAHLSARPELAAQLCRAAIDQTDATADPVAAGLLHERLGRYLWMAADGAAGLHAYRRAEALVPADPPTRSRARVLSGLSQALMLAGRMAEARATAEAAIDMAQRVGARDVEGHARNNRGVALAYLGEVDAGVAQLQQARHLAEVDSDDVDDVARAIVNLCSVLIDAGRLEEAADVALDGVAVVNDLGLERRKGVWCRCDAADALLRSGRWDEAERLIDDALVLDPSGIDHVRSKWMRGVLRLRRGDLDGAAADLTWAHDGMASTIDAQFLGPLHAHLIELWLARGAPERALAIAEEGWDRLSERPAAYAAPLAAMATSAAADLAELAARSRRSPTGGTTTWLWVERCAAVLSSGSVCAPEPQAWLLMAQAYHGTALGQADAASWEAAADAWRCAGQPFWHAHAERRHAEVLLRSGDRQRAQSVLRDARARSDALGATLLTADIDALARRSRLDVAASARPTPGYTAPYRLTRREHQILGLLAEGRTNRQIADQLFVSHRTIGTHVSNLLGKLGAATRSEAAAIAHREGLL